MTEKKGTVRELANELPGIMNGLLDEAYAVTGKRRVVNEHTQLLSMFYPDCSLTSDGLLVMSRDDARKLTRIAELFGLTEFQANANRKAAVDRLYDVCVMTMKLVVGNYFSYAPNVERFHRAYEDWPQDWRDYVVAVCEQDVTEIQRLVAKLRPLADDCVYPEHCYMSYERARAQAKGAGR